MRKLDRMTLVRDFDLFPVPERLLNLERKYGDSLSHEDLYGMPAKSKKRRQLEETSAGIFDQSHMMSAMQSQSKTQAALTTSVQTSSKIHASTSQMTSGQQNTTTL